MKHLVIKAGVNELPLFTADHFPLFEAYLSPDDNPSDLLATDMELVAIHMPNSVRIGKEFRLLNFADGTVIGRKSLEKLMEIITFANYHSIKYVILHLGFFDPHHHDRFAVLDNILSLLSKIEKGKVKICIENIPCWTNLSFMNEPVVSDAQHLKYFIGMNPDFGAVLDIDHLSINSTFQFFYNGFKEKKYKNTDRNFMEQMENEINEFSSTNTEFFKKLIHEDIKRAFTMIKPDIIHATGSDYCQYRMIGGLPLIGEALPIGFKGMIRGVEVEDRIDHSEWVSCIPEDVLITLELMKRPDYDYVQQIKSSWLKVFKLLTEVHLSGS